MTKKFGRRTTAVVASLLLSTLLTCLAVYEQIEISSLVARNNYLREDLNETSDLLNLTKSELSSLHEDYSTLLRSYNNLSARLLSLENSLALLSEALEHLDTPIIFFDKSIYYPTQEAFWNRTLSLLSVGITVLDKDVLLNSITVNVSSSIDYREVKLNRSTSGVFSGKVLAKALRLDENIADSNVLNVRYGGRIAATYNYRMQTTALVLFPKWIGGEMGSSEWAMFKVFDSNGVLLVDYGRIGLQYNPVFIGNYALANYQEYLNTANTSFKDKFLVQANWFVKNAKPKIDFGVWEYTFDWPWNAYNVTVPYVSALAQGNGLSVLARAYIMTGNVTYLEVAETAMKSFEYEMNEGGVRHTDSDGVWYEEIADEGAISGKVLNGFIGSLMRLYEFSFGVNDAQGFALFGEGMRTLTANIHQFDTGSWSYYDLLSHSLASTDYHKAHISQLKIMYELTGNNTFLEYSNKFESYLRMR